MWQRIRNKMEDDIIHQCSQEIIELETKHLHKHMECLQILFTNALPAPTKISINTDKMNNKRDGDLLK